MTARSRYGPLVLIVLALVLLSCSVPTDAPIWDSRWILPTDHTVVEVSEYLPDGVSVTPDGQDFSVSIDPFDFSETLGEVCPACGALNGQTVPKPAFSSSIEGSGTLPSEVVSATVSLLQVQIQIANHFGFDPIRPKAGVFGSLNLRVWGGPNAQTLLDEIDIDGADQAFPSGTSLDRTVMVSSAQVGSTFRVELAIDSPAGDPVTVNTSLGVEVHVTPETVLVSSATVEVAGREVSTDPVELNLGDVESDIVDRIQSGALEFLVENPIRTPVDFTLRITGGFPDIVKQASLSGAASSTTRVEFTQDELHTFLGKDNVLLTGTGTVPAGTPSTTVAPQDTVKIDTRLDAVLRIGD
jgi:hypothetical protein